MPIFNPADRLIFSYPSFEGGPEGQMVKKCIDPLDLQTRLLDATRGRFDELMEQQYADQPKPEKIDDKPTGNIDPPKPEDILKARSARIALAQATIRALECQEVDPNTGKGVTKEWALDVLQLFLDFMEAKKKDGRELSSLPESIAAAAIAADYSAYVAWHWDAPMRANARIYEMAVAFSIASSDRPMDPEILKAVTSSPLEAQRLAQQINAERATVKARSEYFGKR